MFFTPASGSSTAASALSTSSEEGGASPVQSVSAPPPMALGLPMAQGPGWEKAARFW